MPRNGRRSVPDFIRRGLRQGIGVGALVAIGYEVVEPFGESSKTASQWLTCFKWAAITMIVLTAPVLGKVIQVSFERSIGTIAGGLLGLTTVLLGREMMQASDQAFTAVISGLVGFGSVWAGHRLGLEYAGRLLAMTFILVVIGADGRVDAFLVALTRCSGILLGVLLSVVLAVLIFPKSASHQATDNLAEALSGLCELSCIAWNCRGDAAEPEEVQQRLVGDGGVDIYVPLDGGSSAARLSPHAREALCEKALMHVYDKLSKVDEFLPLAKRERYIMTYRGRWCFLPAIPFLRLSTWTIPAQPMQELATAMRKVSRVLWALHVTFQEGFEEEVLSVLQRLYPAEMMSSLQTSSHSALTDMRDAFPDDTILPSSSLHNFLTAVEDLIRISGRRRQRVLQSQGCVPTSPDSLAMGPKGTSGRSSKLDLPGRPLDIQADSSKSQLPLSTSGSGRLDTALGIGRLTGREDGIEFGDEPVPSIAADQLDLFPQTASGYISKVRWFSFQFLTQQLAEEVDRMHRSMGVVLKMLPNALEARHI